MIELRNVSKIYPGNQVAVQDVSFEVREGETVVLIGASGCGKTTTLKMINRLIESTSGEIFVENDDVRTLNPVNLRRRIGYVIQKIGLFPHMTIGENVMLVPSLTGWPEAKKRDRAHELMSLVGLAPNVYFDRLPHELSGGQQQRVGVARALAADPPILLMDEPFGALDPITRRDIQQEFLNLKRKIAKTIVFVTHDIIEAVTLGGRIAVMNRGKIIQLGTPGAILAEPANPMVETIIGHQIFQLTLSSETIRSVVEREPLAASADILSSPARQVRSMMEEKGIGILPVVDENQYLVGTITHKTLENSEGGMAIEKVLAAFPASVRDDTSLLTALNSMIEKNDDALSVSNRAGKLCGILYKNRLLGAVQELFAGEDKSTNHN